MVDDIKHDKMKICKKKNFPFLDIESFYNDVDNLRFRVHSKENQKLKCLNKPSVHTKACFKSMPNSVFKRLTRLATINNDNTNKSVDKIYPDHIKALRKAELIGMKDWLPTFKEQLVKEKEDNVKKENKSGKKGKENKHPRNAFFVLAIANVGKSLCL